MSVYTLLLALPIFFVVYQGIEMIMESKSIKGSRAAWGKAQAGHNRLREVATLGSKIGFNKALLQNKRLREGLDLLLIRSGHPFGWRAEDVLFYKELCAIFLGIIIYRVADSAPIGAVLGGVVAGFILPNLYLKIRVGNRQKEIQRFLPGFTDLLALALESGLDLLAAIERIIEKMKANALREELQTVLQESRLGTARKEILLHFAFRTDLGDIQSLSSIIIQCDELGTSLATVLRNYAEDMRSRRISRAEEIGGKAPVKLLFPMMVFFFPIVFVIIMGPLALSFISSYK